MKYRRLFQAVLLASFFLATSAAEAQTGVVWYLSNTSGMALRPAPSRIVALRSEYSLAMSIITLRQLPEILKPYYDDEFPIDFRILYEKGKPTRQQWVFRGGRGRSRLSAVAVIKEVSSVKGESTLGYIEDENLHFAFIERYDEDGLLVMERLFADDDSSETTSEYFYEEGTLASAETRMFRLLLPKAVGEAESEEEEAADAAPGELVQADYYTDYYKYTRPGSIRAVERIFHRETVGAETATAAALTPLPRTVFPALRPHPDLDPNFVKPSAANNSTFIAEAIAESPVLETVAKIVYDTDTRGRVLKESHYAEDGTSAGEVETTWEGDRIARIALRTFGGEWVAADEKVTEYEYDAGGDRILERNINNGALERTVRKEGAQEIEELYMDGRIVLRATWEGDHKVKEERVRD